MFNLFKGLPPLHITRAVLLLCVLSLVMRVLILIILAIEVAHRFLLLLEISPIAFDKSLETAINKFNMALTLDSKIAILIDLSLLETAH